jgi:hypothetical protein
MDTITTAGAGAAVVSPWWLPVIHGISEGASWALPVLGCSWLLMQMYFKLKERKSK